MATMHMYSHTRSELEDFLDQAKVAIVSALIDDGLLCSQEAEEWTATHTIILRRKNIFRTISNLWKKAPKIEGLYFIVVTGSTIKEQL
jgi:hypothetical protein